MITIPIRINSLFESAEDEGLHQEVLHPKFLNEDIENMPDEDIEKLSNKWLIKKMFKRGVSVYDIDYTVPLHQSKWYKAILTDCQVLDVGQQYEVIYNFDVFIEEFGLVDVDLKMPYVLDVNSEYTKFLNNLGVGVSKIQEFNPESIKYTKVRVKLNNQFEILDVQPNYVKCC